MQKQGHKRDAIRFVGFDDFKITLILLIKAIVVQVRILIIKGRKAGFQRLFLKFCLDWNKKSLILVLILQIDILELFK